jgi:hypothetical protein
VSCPDLIASVHCTDRDLTVALTDGRTQTCAALVATPAQREHFEIGRFGVHWPEIDEDIELAGQTSGRSSVLAHRSAR